MGVGEVRKLTHARSVLRSDEEVADFRRHYYCCETVMSHRGVAPLVPIRLSS